MDGADLCFEIVNRVHAGFVYSEAVARWEDKFILIIEVGDNDDENGNDDEDGNNDDEDGNNDDADSDKDDQW